MGVVDQLLSRSHGVELGRVILYYKMRVCSLASGAACLLLIGSVVSECDFEGTKICEGAVTKESDRFLNICLNGKVKPKLKSTVPGGYPLVGRDTGPGKDCIWYGVTYCDGDVIVDLYRWWFESKCSKGKMRVRSRPYSEVVNDPRYKARQAELAKSP